MARGLLMMSSDAPSPSRDELVTSMREIRTLVERQRENAELWEGSSPVRTPDWHRARFSPSQHEEIRPLLYEDRGPVERRLRKELMRLHRAIEEYSSFLDGGAVVSTREWFVLGSWGGQQRGMIPRDVVEAMGIDCSAEDRGGTTFFSKDQADIIHAHRDWQPFQ
jgi:hypothetical protein